MSVDWGLEYPQGYIPGSPQSSPAQNQPEKSLIRRPKPQRTTPRARKKLPRGIPRAGFVNNDARTRGIAESGAIFEIECRLGFCNVSNLLPSHVP